MRLTLFHVTEKAERNVGVQPFVHHWRGKAVGNSTEMMQMLFLEFLTWRGGVQQSHPTSGCPESSTTDEFLHIADSGAHEKPTLLLPYKFFFVRNRAHMARLHIFNPLQYKCCNNFVYPFSSGMNGILHCISAALMDFIGIYLSKLFDFFRKRSEICSFIVTLGNYK